MQDNRKSRIRRARRVRGQIGAQTRLCVFRSNLNIYAQVISPCGGKVLASASTLDPVVKKNLKNGGDIPAAREVGKLVAERAQKAGVDKVSFDRSGFRYHGRVRALAEAARENGLHF